MADINERGGLEDARPCGRAWVGNEDYDNVIRQKGASVARGLNLDKYNPQPVHPP